MRFWRILLLLVGLLLPLTACAAEFEKAVAGGQSGPAQGQSLDPGCQQPVGEPGPGANGTYECVPLDQLPTPAPVETTEMPADAPAEAVEYAAQVQYLGSKDTTFHEAYFGDVRLRGFEYADGTIIIQTYKADGSYRLQTIYDIRIDQRYK